MKILKNMLLALGLLLGTFGLVIFINFIIDELGRFITWIALNGYGKYVEAGFLTVVVYIMCYIVVAVLRD